MGNSLAYARNKMVQHPYNLLFREGFLRCTQNVKCCIRFLASDLCKQICTAFSDGYFGNRIFMKH
ncbi:hypothetical protein BT93_F0631 [Corymbia citriodora subsp. variegata]|nr:hypothetical protein BT93_F0631 [Corymbia citriodora subsp. variegata]